MQPAAAAATLGEARSHAGRIGANPHSELGRKLAKVSKMVEGNQSS
jgi:hypothetical protein